MKNRFSLALTPIPVRTRPITSMLLALIVLLCSAEGRASELIDDLTCTKIIKLGLLKKERRAICEPILKNAKTGHAESQFNVGLTLRGGPIANSYWVEAAHWLKLSADQGHVMAARTLATMHEQVHHEIFTLRGLFGEKQTETAEKLLPYFLPANRFNWHRKAAVGGHPQSMEYVAGSYLKGDIGVDKSKTAALEWYARAAVHYLDEVKRRDEALRVLDTMEEIDSDSVYTLAVAMRIYGRPTAPEPLAPAERKSKDTT